MSSIFKTISPKTFGPRCIVRYKNVKNVSLNAHNLKYCESKTFIRPAFNVKMGDSASQLGAFCISCYISVFEIWFYLHFFRQCITLTKLS